MRGKIATAQVVRRRTIRQGITMKRILFTTVSLGVLGLMSPALGADLPTYSKAPVVVSPLYDWSGFYVGAYGGGGFSNHKINLPAIRPVGFLHFTVNYDSTQGIARGRDCYNALNRQIPVGLEVD